MHEFRASGCGGLCRLISECAHSGQEAVTGVWTSVLGAMLSAELGARVRDSSAGASLAFTPAREASEHLWIAA